MTEASVEREAHRSEYSCGDNSCVFGAPGGMATNGGCRCFDDLPRTPDGRVSRRRLSLGIYVLRDRIKSLAAALAKCEQREELWREYVALIFGPTFLRDPEASRARVKRNDELREILGLERPMDMPLPVPSPAQKGEGVEMAYCKICGGHMPGQTPHTHTEQVRRLARYDEAIRLLRKVTLYTDNPGMDMEIIEFLSTEPRPIATEPADDGKPKP